MSGAHSPDQQEVLNMLIQKQELQDMINYMEDDDDDSAQELQNQQEAQHQALQDMINYMEDDDDDDEEDEDEDDEDDEYDRVQPPICKAEYTFLPDCCANIKTCGSCQDTKEKVNGQTDASLADKALKVDINAWVC